MKRIGAVFNVALRRAEGLACINESGAPRLSDIAEIR